MVKEEEKLLLQKMHQKNEVEKEIKNIKNIKDALLEKIY